MSASESDGEEQPLAAVEPLHVPACLPPSERPGLRERKKLRTYETIAAVALDLFDRQGFRATTIAQIAEAADVSPRTVSAYFPAKEDLLFPHTEEMFGILADRLRDRPAGQFATEALRLWIGELFDVNASKLEHERERMRRRVIDADEALLAYERQQMGKGERLFAHAIARDLGTEPDDVAAQLAAAAAVGALAAIGRVHDEQEREFTDPERHRDAALALVDQAIVFLSGGIRELRAQRGDPPLRAA
ncbi:MAG TPA: helix-turn-helix domain-containing protein [Conexibacter sp.]|nr:helix-turn-helix domain-containing protein [Conexibacter sp.]